MKTTLFLILLTLILIIGCPLTPFVWLLISPSWWIFAWLVIDCVITGLISITLYQASKYSDYLGL